MSDSDFTIPISQSTGDRAESNTEYGYKVLKLGDVLNHRFEIIKELGSGGFATTYLAVDRQSETGKKCAVKQLQPRFNSSSVWESAKERFATEAMVLQWLGKQERIPDFICHFEENQQFYLVLEFIEGEEFEQEVRYKTLNEAQAIEFLTDVLTSLKSVHQQGIIHRDIKPSNLIRRKKDGKIILIDFGAVKEIGTMAFDSSKQQIQTQIIGTPGYMPPEQNNGKPVYSSDIYALGRTAIFAMTNKSPMEWEESEPEGISAWNKKIAISEAFLKIINRMMATNIAERYTSAREVLEDLKPLEIIETIIADKYRVVKYLGGTSRTKSYIANSLGEEDKSRYYLEIIKPENNQNSLSETTKQIMLGLNHLSRIDSHKRTPVVIEYFVDRSKIYIIQEYIEGRNLAQIVEDQFILSEAEVIEILTDTAFALQPIHRQQVIHGNIQPSSLIRRQRDGKIALVNFGLVREAIDVIPDSKTGYIPPEQIAGRASYVSDIYALGMTAIHILTGTSPDKLPRNARTGEINWHRKARISPSFAKVLDKTISLDKNKRHQSLKKLIRDLNKIKKKPPVRGMYKYLLVAPVLIFALALIYTQWAQRVAILEFYEGDRFLRENQYQQAINYYSNGLNRLPKTRKQVGNYEPVWLKKAKAQRQLQKYEEALQTCSTALKYYQSPQLWNCKALTLYSLKRYDSAVKAYDSAIEIAPQDVWLWNNRGEAYTRLQQPDKAIFDFQKAIDLSPNRSFVPWNNLGKLYFQQKEYELAIEAYEESLKVKPDYLPALIGMGNAQKSSRLYDSAAEAYDRALAIDPNYHEAWFGKGSVAEYLGQYSNARDYYRRASQLKPNWEAAANALDRVERKLGSN